MADWTKEEMESAYRQVMAKARTDAAYRAKLIEDPRKAISEVGGKEIPESYKIRIIEQDPAYDATFFLPAMVDDEFSADDLDEISGGSSCAYNEGCRDLTDCAAWMHK